MGFINTEYTDTMNSLIDGFKDRLKNNMYVWNDKNNTIVTYYNINIELSTLDQATKLSYIDQGQLSGLKFNKINNFMIYGLDKIALMVDNGEFGIESAEVSGDAFVLPNTIIPYAGDFFTIDHEKDKLLFKVVNAYPDTVDNGSNIYKIEYKVTSIGDEDLNKYNIAYTYEMIFNNVGTSFKPVIRSDKYNNIIKLDAVISELKKFYIDLFYSDRVQTFIFLYKTAHFYDPFVIEFLIRTKILFGKGSDYVYLGHQITPYNTFNIDYDRSIFKCIEDKDKEGLSKAHIKASGEVIESKTNIFSTRYETYFEIVYKDGFLSDINTFDAELISRINSNALYDNDALYNIIIKYFNNVDIEDSDIEALDDINYENNIKLFYGLPCVIYCLERYIKTLMS